MCIYSTRKNSLELLDVLILTNLENSDLICKFIFSSAVLLQAIEVVSVVAPNTGCYALDNSSHIHDFVSFEIFASRFSEMRTEMLKLFHFQWRKIQKFNLYNVMLLNFAIFLYFLF